MTTKVESNTVLTKYRRKSSSGLMASKSRNPLRNVISLRLPYRTQGYDDFESRPG